jgi:hypothetical protein
MLSFSEVAQLKRIHVILNCSRAMGCVEISIWREDVATGTTILPAARANAARSKFQAKAT